MAVANWRVVGVGGSAVGISWEEVRMRLSILQCTDEPHRRTVPARCLGQG